MYAPLPSPLPPLHCSYDSGYEEIYQPTYDVAFVFYDEDDIESDDTDNDFIPPLPIAGSLTNR
jgi:hypothetical protein